MKKFVCGGFVLKGQHSMEFHALCCVSQMSHCHTQVHINTTHQQKIISWFEREFSPIFDILEIDTTMRVKSVDSFFITQDRNEHFIIQTSKKLVSNQSCGHCLSIDILYVFVCQMVLQQQLQMATSFLNFYEKTGASRYLQLLWSF